MKIQTTIDILERIVNAAKEARKYDDSLSLTIEIEQISETDLHLGSDHIGVILKSTYQECNGKVIFNHWL